MKKWPGLVQNLRYYLGSPTATAASATTFPSQLLEGALESIFSKNGRRIDKFTCCPVSTLASLGL